MIIRAYVRILPVFQSESAGYRSKLNKAAALIKVPCVDIALDDRIELQYAETAFFRARQAVHDEFFTDVEPARS